MAQPPLPLPLSLCAEDREQFMRDGFLRVPQAFSAEAAELARREMWQLLEERGVHRSRPASWSHTKVGLDCIFTAEDGEPWSHVLSPKLIQALDAVLGEGRYDKNFGCGWWMITFPSLLTGTGTGDESMEAWGADGRWHIDGWHHHYLFSKEIGLVINMFFSDVLPSGGGTALAVGSHIIAAQLLAEAGLKGISSRDLSNEVAHLAISQNRCKVLEARGNAGDVLLMHPLLLHARSKNLGQPNAEFVRIMCHPTVALSDHMSLASPEVEEKEGESIVEKSLLEESIRRAVVYNSEKQCGVGEMLLRRITPEACLEFTDQQRQSIVRKRNFDTFESSDITNSNVCSVQNEKMVRFEINDENYTNSIKFVDNSCVSRESEEIMDVMGFGSFGSSRNFPPPFS